MSTDSHAGNRFSRREMLRGMGLGAASVVLAACAPGGSTDTASEASDTSDGGASEGMAEVVWHCRTGANEEYYSAQADAFHAAQDSVRVNIEATPNAEYQSKIATLAAAGDLGDSYWGNVFGQLYPFASAGIALDVTPLIEASEISTDDFFDVGVQQITWDNKIIGLPTGGHPGWTTIYTNKDAFEAAGVDVPAWEWTYDKEFLENMQAVNEATDDGKGRFAFLFDYVAQNCYTFIRSWGGDWVDADAKNATLLTDEALEAMKFIRDLVHEYKISPRQDQLVEQMFANDLAITWNTGIWQYGRLVPIIEDKFNWQGYPSPAGPGGRGSFIGCNTFCINSNGDQIDSAFEWGKWLVSPEVQLMATADGQTPPFLKSAWEDPSMADDPTLQAMRQWLEVATPWSVPANARALEFRNTFNQGLSSVFNADNDFMTEMENLNTSIQGVLDKPTI